MLELIMDTVIETYYDVAGSVESAKTEVTRAYDDFTVAYKEASKPKYQVEYEDTQALILVSFNTLEEQRVKTTQAIETLHGTTTDTTDTIGSVPISPRYGEFERMVEAEDDKAVEDKELILELNLQKMEIITVSQSSALELLLINQDEYSRKKEFGERTDSQKLLALNAAQLAMTAVVVPVAGPVFIATAVVSVAYQAYDYTTKPEAYSWVSDLVL